MNTESQTDQLKQRIADALRPFDGESYPAENESLLRDEFGSLSQKQQ